MCIFFQEIEPVAAQCEEECVRLKPLHCAERIPAGSHNLVMGCKREPEILSVMNVHHEIELPVPAAVYGYQTDTDTVTLYYERKFTYVADKV